MRGCGSPLISHGPFRQGPVIAVPILTRVLTGERNKTTKTQVTDIRALCDLRYPLPSRCSNLSRMANIAPAMTTSAMITTQWFTPKSEGSVTTPLSEER